MITYDVQGMSTFRLLHRHQQKMDISRQQARTRILNDNNQSDILPANILDETGIPNVSEPIVDFAKTGAKAFRTAALKVHEKTPLPANNVINTYQHLFMPVVGKLLDTVTIPNQFGKAQSSPQETALIHNAKIRYATNYNKSISDSMVSQKKALDRIYDKKRFIEYDLEGIGNTVTEFAFLDMDFSVGDKSEQIKQSAYGLRGIDEETAKKLRDLVDTYERSGFRKNGTVGVPDNQRYILESLAKRGNKKTTTEVRDGLRVLTNYAADEDVEFLNVDDMRRGIDLLLEDRKVITDAGLKEYNIGGRTYDLYADQAKILNMFQYAKDNGIALTGYNVFQYDNPNINHMFNLASNGDARIAWRNITQTGDISDAFDIFDPVLVHREKNNPHAAISYKINQKLAEKPGEGYNSAYGLKVRYAKEDYGDTVARALGIANVKHGAVSDAAQQAFVFEDMMDSVFDPNNKKYFFKDKYLEKERSASAGDIFLFDSGAFNRSSSSNLNFTIDGLNGDIRFNGVRFDSTGKTYKQDIVSPGTKSHAFSMLLGARQLQLDDELSKQLGITFGGSAENKNLVAMFFTQYGNNVGNTAELKDINVWVGSQQEATQMLSSGRFVGSLSPKKIFTEKEDITFNDMMKLASGKYDDNVDVSGVSKKTISQVYPKNDDLITESKKVKFKKAAQIRSKLKQLDSSSRWIRDLSFASAQRSLEFVNFIADTFNMDKAAVIQPFEIQKRAVEILEDHNNVSKVAKIFSFPNWEALPNTIINATNMAGYLWSTKDIYKRAIDAAEKAANEYKNSGVGGSELYRIKNDYFHQYLNNALAYIALDVEKKTGLNYSFSPQQAFGYSVSGAEFLGGKQESSVAIDISPLLKNTKRGIAGLNTQVDNLFVIDPYDTQPFWASRLARTIGTNDEVGAVRALAKQISRDFSFDKDLKKLGSRIAFGGYTANAAMNEVNIALKDAAKKYPELTRPAPINFIDGTNGPAPVQFLYSDKYTEEEREKVLEKAFSQETQKIVPRESADVLAAQITERLFATTNNIGVAELTALGYSEAEAKAIARDKNLRKLSARRMLSTLLNGVLKDGKYGNLNKLGYNFDETTGRFELFTRNNVYDFTKFLPFDRFDKSTGRFNIQFGGTMIAPTAKLSNIGINPDKPSFLSVQNPIDIVSDKLAEMIPHALSPNRSLDESLSLAQWMLGQSIDQIRPLGETRFDQEDTKLGRMLGLGPFMRRLGIYYHNGAYEGVTLRKNTTELLGRMSDAFTKKGIEEFNLQPNDISVLYQDMDALLYPLSDKDSKLTREVFGHSVESDVEAKSFRENYLPYINRKHIKHPENFLVNLTNTGFTPLGGSGQDSRHTQQIISRAKTWDISNLDLKDSDVFRVGRILNNPSDSEGNMIRGQKLIVDTDVLHTVLAARKKYEQDHPKEEKILSGDLSTMLDVFINENGSVTDPVLLHARQRNIEQKLRTDSETEPLFNLTALQKIHGERIARLEAERRAATKAVVEMTKNGVNFAYGEYVYVNKGDIFAWTQSYQNTATKHRVDRDGFLQRRFYLNGHMLDEAEINDILNKNISEFAGINNLDVSEEEKRTLVEKTAHNILLGSGAQEKYVIKASELLGYNKLADFSEKTLSDFRPAYVGQFDKNIRDVLGVSNLPLYPSDESLKDEKHFLAYLKGNNLDVPAYNDKIKNFDELKKAILLERTTPYNTLIDVLKWGGLLKENDSPITISSSIHEAAKSSHSETENIEASLSDALEARAQKYYNDGTARTKNEAYQMASRDLGERLQKDNVFLDRNGNNLLQDYDGHDGFIIGHGNERLSGLYTTNVGAIRKIVQDFGVDGSVKVEDVNPEVASALRANFGDIGTIAHRETAGLISLSDADEVGLNTDGNQKGIRVTRRLMQNMGMAKVDAPIIEDMRSSYERLIRLSGDDTLADKFADRFSSYGVKSANLVDGELKIEYDTQPHKSINEGIIKNLQEEIILGDRFYAYGDKRKTTGIVNDFANDRNTKEELESIGINASMQKELLKGYKHEYGKDVIVGKENFIKTAAYFSARKADVFNRTYEAAKTLEEKEKVLADFQQNPDFSNEVHISDLHFNNQRAQGDPLNALTGSYVVDFGDNRKIAIPLEPTSIMDNYQGEGARENTTLRKLLMKAQNKLSVMNEGDAGQRDRAKVDYDNLVSQIQDEVKNLTSTKTGLAPEATSGYMYGSGVFKANIIKLTDNNFVYDRDTEGKALKQKVVVNDLMENAMVDGISLASHVRAGHNVNAVFLGKDFFKNAIGNDFLERFGLEKGDIGSMLGDVNKLSAVGLQGRQPAEYSNSFGGAYIFYDKTLASNQARVVQNTLSGQNGDQDGDLVYAMLARENAQVTIQQPPKTDKDGNKIEQAPTIINTRINQVEAEMLRRNGYDVSFKGNSFDAYARSAETIGTSMLSGIDISANNLSKMENDIRARYNNGKVTVNGIMYDQGQLLLQERYQMEQSYNKEIANSDQMKAAVAQYNQELAKRGVDYRADEGNLTLDDLGQRTIKSNVEGVADFTGSVADFYAQQQGVTGKEAEVVANHINMLATDEEVARTIGKENAGIINMSTYRMSGIMKMLQDRGLDNGLTTGDEEIVGQIMAHIKEAGQAPKNASDLFSSIQGLEGAVKSFFGVGNRGGQIVRDKQPLMNLIYDMMDSPDGIKELKKLPVFANGGEEVTKERVTEAFDHIMEDGKSLSSSVYDAFTVGYGKTASKELDLEAPDPEDMLSHVQKMGNEYIANTGYDSAKWKTLSDDDILINKTSNNAINLSDNVSKYEDSVYPDALPEPTLQDELQGAFRSLKKISHGRGAMAMLGFAGATMMAGMIGGAPTAPTSPDGQAQGIQSENAMYEIPSTMSGQGTQSGANQSYIINVNASTDQGRDFATNAINQAFSQMPQASSGVTMTMNIKDSSSNISTRDIASYVSSML